MPARHEVPTLTERGGGAIQGCFFNEVVLLGFGIEGLISPPPKNNPIPMDRAGISEQNMRGTFRPVRARPRGGSSTSVRFFLQGRIPGPAECSPPSAERSRPRWAPRLVSGGEGCPLLQRFSSMEARDEVLCNLVRSRCSGTALARQCPEPASRRAGFQRGESPRDAVATTGCGAELAPQRTLGGLEGVRCTSFFSRLSSARRGMYVLTARVGQGERVVLLHLALFFACRERGCLHD